jgi:hypothetical protein
MTGVREVAFPEPLMKKMVRIDLPNYNAFVPRQNTVFFTKGKLEGTIMLRVQYNAAIRLSKAGYTAPVQ